MASGMQRHTELTENGKIMLRTVVMDEELVDGQMDGNWPVMNAELKPYSGLSVELYSSGEIWTIIENNEGYFEGYGVTYDKNGLILDVDEYFSHRKNGLLAVWNSAGRLVKAERYEEDIKTSEYQFDGEAVRQIEIEGVEEDITQERSYLNRFPDPIPNSISELLERFDGKGEALYREAQLGLGLE